MTILWMSSVITRDRVVPVSGTAPLPQTAWIDYDSDESASGSHSKRGCSMTLSANDFVLRGLTAEDDLTHPIRDVADWSENYLSHASFPSRGMSHWLHLGRAPWDRTQ